PHPPRPGRVRLPAARFTRRATGADTGAVPPAITRSRPIVPPEGMSTVPPATTTSCATGALRVRLPPATRMLPPTFPLTLTVPPAIITSRLTVPDPVMVPPAAVTVPLTLPPQLSVPPAA